MKQWNSKQIRQQWLDFWASKNHKVLPSKSLIPQNDPSLLWINSGVATLKDYFSGKKIPPQPRLTNSQKSLRTNDIENVGLTSRHHTFFEMLGNFSIGDYGKEKAIEWAYELLFTIFEFDPAKIYITYFEEDKETYQKWLALGINQEHLIAGNKEMNFWDVGQGPCGPDTEIFYDRGLKFDPDKVGLKLLKNDLENDRYIEIWNIVFSELNNDGTNNYAPLAQKNIDTGAGLERISAIMQDAPTNFDTDLFLPIIKEVTKLTTLTYQVNNYFSKEPKQQSINYHFKVIADHMRAIVMAIADGAKPSNTQRGYVIRRLIRRAYRAGLALEIKSKTFLHLLVKIVTKVLDVYPVNEILVSEIIKKEELAFSLTIEQGEKLLQEELAKSEKTFSPQVAFKLFDTYGFPVEITQEILTKHNITLDLKAFNKLKDEHAKVSKGKKVSALESQIQVIQKIEEKQSAFIGYQSLQTQANIIFQGKENEKWYVLLDKTPFYATGGGQRADQGILNEEKVLDVFKDKYGNHWHVINKKLPDGPVLAIVDQQIRARKAANHSGTHLLGAALAKLYGKQTIQLGSDNNEFRLTYDFPLTKRLDKEQIQEVEDLVNSWIKASYKRQYILTTASKALKMGAVALEGEDYGENVRVVKFAHIIDFCGGTHVANTQDIEQFKITKFESRGTGIFRIVAITTKNQVALFEKEQVKNKQELLLALIKKNKQFVSDYNLEVPMELIAINKQIEKAQNDFRTFNKTKPQAKIDTNIKFKSFYGKKTHINLNVESSLVKKTAIELREAHPDALILIGSRQNNQTILAAASKKYDALAMFKQLSTKYEGKGGGNVNFAMGSLKLIDRL